MIEVHVHIKVKSEDVKSFREATLENARASVREAGIARFELLEDIEDSTRFVLVEVYRTMDATAGDKATDNYAKWRDTVAPMMAVPRTSRKFTTAK